MSTGSSGVEEFATVGTTPSIDATLLSLSLTKEQLRDIALSRLSELRQHIQNEQRQNQELRQFNQLLQERLAEQQQDQSSVTDVQQPTNQQSINNSPTEIQPTQRSSARVQQPSANIQSIAGSAQFKT